MLPDKDIEAISRRITDDAAHERRLGRIAIVGQQLEVTIALLMAESLDVTQPVGSLIANRLSLERAITLIGDLAKRDDYRLDGAAVLEWLPKARKAIEKRNFAIHTPWAADSLTLTHSHIVKKDLALERRSPAELDQILKLILATIAGGQALLSKPQTK